MNAQEFCESIEFPVCRMFGAHGLNQQVAVGPDTEFGFDLRQVTGGVEDGVFCGENLHDGSGLQGWRLIYLGKVVTKLEIRSSRKEYERQLNDRPK